MRERSPGRYRGRILLLAIMVGGALLAQSLLSRRSASTSEADDGVLVSPRSQARYESQVSFWKTLPVVPVDDLGRLEAGISQLVQSVPVGVSERFIEAEALVRDMAQFLWVRCSSATAEEYLSRAADIRRVRTDNVADDLEIHHWYRALMGRVPPADINPAELMDEFWKRAKHPANRIVGVSTEGHVRMAPTKPVRAEVLDQSPLKIKNAAWPDWSSVTEGIERWSNPYDGGFPRLTEPEGRSLSEVLRERRTTTFCLVRLVGRSESGDPVPLGLLLYLSPQERRWHVLEFTNQHVGGLGRPY